MVAKEPEEYRPRRALIESPEADDPETDALSKDAEPKDSGPENTGADKIAPVFAAEDDRPLFRDEVPASEDTVSPEPVGPGRVNPEPVNPEPVNPERVNPERVEPATSESPVSDQTVVAAGAKPGRLHRPGADESTQILPRTRGSLSRGKRASSDPADDLDALDERDIVREPMAQRTKLALLVSAVAAVVILGLAVGYAVLHLGEKPAAGGQPTPTMTKSEKGPPGSTVDPNILLKDSSMLSVAAAKQLDTHRVWKVALTQRGVGDTSPQPACLDTQPVDGQPSAQQTILRLLSSSGNNAPGILHQADAYATPEEAAQAYALAAKSLGGCVMAGAYIDSGLVVSGLGDQAVSIIVKVTTGSKTQFRSVVLNRTGRVVNIVDVARPDQAVPPNAVAKALASATNAQCRTSGGNCASAPTVKPGPPPIGGDEPGFLASGDLPPVGKPTSTWVGAGPAAPDPDYTGSGCETVNWAKVQALTRTSRTYLLADTGGAFGLDEIIVTLQSAKAASDLVKSVKGDLTSCPKRKLTATVPKPDDVKGTGAAGIKITGWAANVSQKTTGGIARYRVGLVFAGAKVVYTFLNPQKDLDLTDAQWRDVTVRAGERATQVR